MKRVQHTHNASNTQKMERLISNTKNKEKSKKTEQVLILGIVLFCLSMLYFVFATSNSSSDDSTRPHNVTQQPYPKENTNMSPKSMKGTSGHR